MNVRKVCVCARSLARKKDRWQTENNEQELFSVHSGGIKTLKKSKTEGRLHLLTLSPKKIIFPSVFVLISIVFFYHRHRSHFSIAVIILEQERGKERGSTVNWFELKLKCTAPSAAAAAAAEVKMRSEKEHFCCCCCHFGHQSWSHLVSTTNHWPFACLLLVCILFSPPPLPPLNGHPNNRPTPLQRKRKWKCNIVPGCVCSISRSSSA